MKKRCDEIQELLAAEGAEVLSFNPAAREHLAECPECFRFLESLQELDSTLAQLPDYDARDEIVEWITERVSKLGPPTKQKPTRGGFPLWQTLRLPSNRALGTIATVFLAVIVTYSAIDNLGTSAEQSFTKVGAPLGSGYSDGSGYNDAKFGDVPPPGIVDRILGSSSVARDRRTAGTNAGDRNALSGGNGRSYLTGGGGGGGDGSGSGGNKLKQFLETEDAPQAEKGKKTPLSSPGKGNKLGTEFDNWSQHYPGERKAAANPQGMGSEEAYGDLVQALKEQVDEAKTTQAEQAAVIGRIKNDLNEKNAQTAGIFENLVDRVDQLSREMELRTKGTTAGSADTDAAKTELYKLKVIKPGDTVNVQLLTGVTAPVDGSPYPVIFELNSSHNSLEDKPARDAYLDSALTTRGIPIMSMGFLDKTVGAGLTAIQQEADKKTIAALLSQISWAGVSRQSEADKEWARIAFEASKRLVTSDGTKSDTLGSENKNALPEQAAAKKENENFFRAMRNTSNLKFVPATGYWANTYVPGDSTVRELQTTLVAKDKPQLAQAQLGLHELSSEVSQPFDAPQSAALGLNIHSDRTGLQGEGRMIVQIGLKGTAHSAGRRPPLNLGVLLDLREELSAESAEKLRELLFTLNDAKDIGDTFRLSVAGKPGGIIIPASDFKRGALTVALDKILDQKKLPESALDLPAAYEDIISNVASSDDPNSPLGSSEVILITDQKLGTLTPVLTGLAQKSAIAGIPTSAIALGEKADLSELESLVLAGQGSRRVMHSKSDAKEIISRELTSVSRAVAKAVRLRIRLAPGVKLVGVLGSYRLDKSKSKQVRAAEKSIDQRLAKNLGIEADRGKDEDGIQIIIPTFYSGDSHVIMLDVVAPGPGQIAEVRARYKDLLHSTNAVVTQSLSLGSSESPAGALEQNVIKNLLALNLSSALKTMSLAVKFSEPSVAIELARSYGLLVDDAKAVFPDLNRDANIAADSKMLGNYTVACEQLSGSDAEYLSQSLAYAANLKVLPAPIKE